MVEFGLKLEDNKVSEWSEHYIHYEKLKAILKNCETALQRFQELEDRRPDFVQRVREEYLAGAVTPQASKVDLPSLESKGLTSDSEGSAQPQAEEGMKRSPSFNAISRALSGVSDYFAPSGTKGIERQIRDRLKQIDRYREEFKEALTADIGLVNSFYDDKLQELQSRLTFLIETVGNLRGEGILPSTSMDDVIDEETSADHEETPLLSHRKQSISPVHMAKSLVKHMSVRMHKKPEDETKADLEQEAIRSKDARSVREIESIQRALVDQYRTAKLLHNFAIMNYTGFVKIVKKHDKTDLERKKHYKKTVEPDQICHEGKAVEAMANRMEELYAAWFCDRNVSEARAQMLPKKGDSLDMDWSQLRLGYRMGMCSVLGMWVCWDCIWGLLSQGQSTIGGRTAFPVFRACGGLLLLQWFWGMSKWIWSRYRVNYIYLFDFNPHIVDTPLMIFDEAVDNTLIFLTCMLLYYKAGVHDIPGNFPAGVFPFILVVVTIYKLIFPLRTRGPMWHSIWLVVTAPMTSPSFYHGYVGDIFTSMVKVFQDMAWTAFFILSGDWLISEDVAASLKHKWSSRMWYRNALIPMLTLLPLWIRFNQCLRRYLDTGDRFPHLANAAKYALSQTVTLFGAFHPLYMRNKRESDVFEAFWTFAFVASSLYSFTWDVYMDWGLGRPKHSFLGPRLMYPKRSLYYATIGVDLVLRFAWVLTLVPPKTGANFALPAYLTSVSMMLELFRRTVWGFLRLENEHRSNTAGFRRVGFVPLHFTTGHKHGYKKEAEHRGGSVLFEVSLITLAVVGACVISVVAAQHASERANAEMDGL